MTSVLSNFLTIRRTRGDVLDPVSFRTAVDMIRGIMKKYNYAELTTDYQSFLAHIINYNDPHHDLNTDFVYQNHKARWICTCEREFNADVRLGLGPQSPLSGDGVIWRRLGQRNRVYPIRLGFSHHTHQSCFFSGQPYPSQ